MFLNEIEMRKFIGLKLNANPQSILQNVQKLNKALQCVRRFA